MGVTERVRELTTFVRGVAAHDSPLSNRVGALGRFARRQLHKRLSRAPLVVTWEGLQLEVPNDAHFAAAAYYLRRPDWWEFSFAEAYLRPGDTVFDVGANVGVCSLFFAKHVGASGRVVACEPDRSNVARLRSNLARNSFTQAECIEQAVGDHVGEVRFVIGEDTVSRLESVAGGAHTVTVPMTTLDTLAATRAVPSYVKVDVEGAEPLVLAGAGSLLKAATPPVFLLEIQDSSARDLDAFARAHGWSFATYDPARRRLEPASPLRRAGNNLLLVRDVAAVNARLGSRAG